MHYIVERYIFGEKVMADGKGYFSKPCCADPSQCPSSVCRDDGCLLFLASGGLGPLHKGRCGSLRRHADEGKMLSVHLLLDCLQPNCAPTPFSREGISTETASVCKQSPSDAPKRQNLGRLHSHTEMIHIFRNKQKVGFSWRTHQPQAGTHPGF